MLAMLAGGTAEVKGGMFSSGDLASLAALKRDCPGPVPATEWLAETTGRLVQQHRYDQARGRRIAGIAYGVAHRQ